MIVLIAALVLAVILILIIGIGIYTSLTKHTRLDGHPEIKDAYLRFKALECIENKKKHFPSKLRVAIVCVSIGDRKFAKLSRKCIEEYAVRHGYHVEYFTEILDDRYHLMWQKMIAIKNTLKDYDAVMWIDDDIYITNQEIKIESFIQQASTDIILSYDQAHERDPHNRANCGMFIVMNTRRGNEFVDDVLHGYDQFDGRYRTGYFHEQSIINYMYYSRYYRYADILQMQSFRKNWKEGDYCLHLCGATAEDRYDTFSKL